LTQEYTEEKLQEIENNIMSGMDKDVAWEEETNEIALSIAHSLLKNGVCTQPYMDKEYKWALRSDNNSATLFCFDVLKFKIAGEKYRPLIANSEIDSQYTYEQNIATLVKSILYHKVGKDILVEEDDNGGE